ncbi:sensor histidine kinase [Candidatus Marithrix sp. Canyon 246]|uniref:sensor histidine kinase n=1 Tax=Candidatus Marithrix sp. Canyon 246 TaxID=1827136 RepID=UPI00084A0973|nr:HAMP domain-containing sensor histidine kinase [Candidatus Marithrix sp. Canyon 246]
MPQKNCRLIVDEEQQGQSTLKKILAENDYEFTNDEDATADFVVLDIKKYRRLLTERVRFEWAVEQSNDGYLLLNNGNIIEYANSSARFYLGLKDDLTPEGFFDYIEKQNLKCEPAAAWDSWPVPNIGTLPRYLVRPESKQSAALWLQVNILEQPSDNINNQLVHLRDVSEHINLQQQVWSFQSMISHKLRAPLHGLVSLQILEQKDDLSSTEAKGLLKIAQDSAKRLRNQILEILRFMDSSKAIKYHDKFKLSDLSTLLTKIRTDLEIKTISIEIDKELEKKSITLTYKALELIIRESFTNSKKFHPEENPAIEIAIHAQDNNRIMLSITDNGNGLPNEELNKVWTPYYQSEKYFTGEVKGMGLGLAMISSIVWGNGGSCRLYNREDESGLIIELILPMF